MNIRRVDKFGCAIRCGLVLLAASVAGCRSADSGSSAATAMIQPAGPAVQGSAPAVISAPAVATSAPPPAALAQRSVVPAQYQLAEAPAPLPPAPPESQNSAACNPCDDDPFAGQAQLDPDALVAAVLARNPSLAAMAAAWQAAVEKYPQVVSLEDPMLSTGVGPGTFGDPNHDVAWMVEGSQKIPWFGKRELRGEQADAEASAARLDLDDAQVRLIATARQALWDYYLVRRQEELNSENRAAIGHFRDSAEAKYRAAQVTQQDVLEADVELAEIERKQYELNRMDTVAVARINTLLHRPTDATLPPPPRKPPAVEAPPPLAWLQEFAAERRPDLAAIGAQVRSEQAAAELAERDYYPDLDFVGRYDAFWQKQDRQLAPFVGVNMNVPLDNCRRQAAVREAADRAQQRRWEYAAKLDAIHSEVQAAYAQLAESDKTLSIYRQKILPAAQQYIDSAQGNYQANTLDFLHLIDAERRSIELREQYEAALAERESRWAELQQAVGGDFGSTSSEPVPAPTAR